MWMPIWRNMKSLLTQVMQKARRSCLRKQHEQDAPGRLPRGAALFGKSFALLKCYKTPHQWFRWKEIECLTYLGSCVTRSSDICTSGAQAAYAGTEHSRCRPDNPLKLERPLHCVAIHSVLFYGYDLRSLLEGDRLQSEIFDHWWLRNFVGIKWDDRMGNANVRNRDVYCMWLTCLPYRILFPDSHTE